MADLAADYWGAPSPAGRIPRGIRNNNPGNIEYGPFARKMGATGSDGRFAIFPSADAGINAMRGLLQSYQSEHGLNTIAGIIGRWAPQDQNDTGAYANAVAKAAGVSPSDPVSMADPDTSTKIINAMISHENGMNPFAGRAASQPQPLASTMGGSTPETRSMPMPLTNAMSGLSNSFVPGIFGGGDQPGYFGKLLSDPTFLMGTSVLGAGLSGKDAGTALQQGAQAAAATSDIADRRRRAMTWQKIFGGAQPDTSSPLLKGIPAEVLPVLQNMGPEEGMKLLGQYAIQRLSPHKIATAAPGATAYDAVTGQPIFQAPSDSPYQKQLATAQAKADVKSGQSAQAGQQILDLTDRMLTLAGEPGTSERQNFENATGPLQGTSWYQGIKGFVNSKAETPVVYNKLQQDLGTIKLLASRAYLSGEGQVTENERYMVADAVGRVESAPNAEAAIAAMRNLKEIVHQVFMKPATGQPGASAATAPNPAVAAGTPQAAGDIVAPGIAVQGGAPQPAPQQAENAPITATGPNGEKVQLDPSGQKWVPMQAPAAAPASATPAGPVDRGPFTGQRPNGPAWVDKWVLRSEAQRNPKIIEQFDAAFGQGAAAQVLGNGTPPPQGQPLGLGRASYGAAR